MRQGRPDPIRDDGASVALAILGLAVTTDAGKNIGEWIAGLFQVTIVALGYAIATGQEYSSYPASCVLQGERRAPGPKGAWTGWLDEALAAAPDHVHLHPALPRSWRYSSCSRCC